MILGDELLRVSLKVRAALFHDAKLLDVLLRRFYGEQVLTSRLVMLRSEHSGLILSL